MLPNSPTHRFSLIILYTTSVFVLIAHLFLISQNLLSNELWGDEAYSLIYTTKGERVREILDPEITVFKTQEREKYFNDNWNLKAWFDIPLRLSDMAEPHPPLFYLSLGFWTSLFGESFLSLRLFPLTISALSLIACFAIGSTLYGVGFGLMLSALFSSSFHFLLHTATTRMHSLTLLLTLLALFFFTRRYWNFKRTFIKDDLSLYLCSFFLALGMLNTFFFVHICFAFFCGCLLIEKDWLASLKLSIVPLLIFGCYLFYSGYWQLKRINYLNYLSHETAGLERGAFFEFNLIEFFENCLLRLSPLEGLYRGGTLPKVLIIVSFFLLLLLPLVNSSKNRKFVFSCFILPILTVLLSDLIFNSFISVWAEGRVVNFLLVSISLAMALGIIQLTHSILKPLGHLFFSLVLIFIMVGNTWHAQSYFQNQAFSFTENARLLDQTSSKAAIITDAKMSFHITAKVFLDFKDVDFFILREPSDLVTLNLQRYQQVIYLKYLINAFPPEQKRQVQAELIQLGFKKLFMLESRGLWGIYDHYDWEVYRKPLVIKREAEQLFPHEPE